MSRRTSQSRRPSSPALAIAALMLVLSLSGAALASTSSGGGDSRADRKLIRSIAPSLSVKHAATAAIATSASNATHAASADTAINAGHAASADTATVGGPLAYASVSATGTVLASRSRGVSSSNVVARGTSIYCFKGLPAFKFALAVTGYPGSGDTTASSAKLAYPDFPSAATFTSDCATPVPGSQLEVNTAAASGPAQRPFYIAFYN